MADGADDRDRRGRDRARTGSVLNVQRSSSDPPPLVSRIRSNGASRYAVAFLVRIRLVRLPPHLVLVLGSALTAWQETDAEDTHHIMNGGSGRRGNDGKMIRQRRDIAFFGSIE